MMRRIIATLLVLVLAAMLIPACGEKKTGKKVGFLVLDLTNPYWNAQVRGARAKAKQLGITLKVYDGQSDPAREIEALENWIAMGADGIIISAIDSRLSVHSKFHPALDRLHLPSGSNPSIARRIFSSRPLDHRKYNGGATIDATP